jgi:hypothetical protein
MIATTALKTNVAKIQIVATWSTVIFVITTHVVAPPVQIMEHVTNTTTILFANVILNGREQIVMKSTVASAIPVIMVNAVINCLPIWAMNANVILVGKDHFATKQIIVFQSHVINTVCASA